MDFDLDFVSFFTGIAGFDLGFEQAGMTCVQQIEYDPYCRQVLEAHYPDVDRSITDVKEANATNLRSGRVFVGGFPCQDLSVAGRRGGLAGERSGLYYEFHRIITECWPEWIVIENVPGLLSSNGGRDFAIVLGGLTGIIPDVPASGWGKGGFATGPYYKVAYRILDSQYFGVPQRRRRVFIVGHITDGRAAEVLFECEGLFWNPPSRKEKREGTPSVAGTIAASGAGTSRPAGQGNELDLVIPSRAYYELGHSFYIEGLGTLRTASPMKNSHLVFDMQRIGDWRESQSAGSLAARDYKAARTLAIDCRNSEAKEEVSGTLQSKKQGYSLNFQNPIAVKIDNQKSNGWGVLEDGTVHTLGGSTDAVAFQQNTRDEVRLMGGDGDIAGALAAQPGAKQQNYIAAFDGRAGRRTLKAERTPEIWSSHYGVRRLTPVECLRLQGFPDDWQDVEGLSDTQKYKQAGNAVTVNVARWIGERIMKEG